MCRVARNKFAFDRTLELPPSTPCVPWKNVQDGASRVEKSINSTDKPYLITICFGTKLGHYSNYTKQIDVHMCAIDRLFKHRIHYVSCKQCIARSH